MKKRCVFFLMVAVAIFAVSCNKEPEPDKTDKYSFTSNDAIVMDVAVSKNDSTVSGNLKSTRTELAAAFGGTIPANLMFYAINSNGKKLVGEDEYTSEYGFYFTAAGDVCMPGAGAVPIS